MHFFFFFQSITDRFILLVVLLLCLCQKGCEKVGSYKSCDLVVCDLVVVVGGWGKGGAGRESTLSKQ